MVTRPSMRAQRIIPVVFASALATLALAQDGGPPRIGTQVNVAANGANIVGDLAREPSISVDPSDRRRLLIAFETIDQAESGLTEAGYAYSRSAGRTWTFGDSLEDGVGRREPVVDILPDGVFVYLATRTDNQQSEVFRSLDGGATWDSPNAVNGGRWPWMAVDRVSAEGRGSLYIAWTAGASCCAPFTFTRSLNGGVTFDEPIPMPLVPRWGTIAISPTGSYYVSGRGSSSSSFIVAIATLRSDPAELPPFEDPVRVDFGGSYRLGGAPNPTGLMGRVWIVAGTSQDPRRGHLYMLSTIDPVGTDPADIHFVRSVDQGRHWSAPIRVNDDAANTNAFQWFGALSIAPNGRLDAAWMDTRDDPSGHTSHIRYSYSNDEGQTWAASTALTPSFDTRPTFDGSPGIGDYMQLVSDDLGAGLVYVGTYNGEQDVYYLRIGGQDCNGNGIADADDIAGGASADCDGNGVPDECDPDCNGSGRPDSCDIADGSSQDCGGNGIPDECEPDCNGNSRPDDCDIAEGTSQDCDGNGIPDECDIAAGRQADCNANGRIDACELATGDAADCDGDGVLDECEIRNGTSDDCNGNGVPDACEIASGAASDCNNNGIPDGCDIDQQGLPDCNDNDVPDSCEIENGAVEDCNSNGIPDICEIAQGLADDCNGNGRIDSCEDNIVQFSSSVLAPFGAGYPQEFAVVDSPEAIGEVTISVAARADLSSASERVDVSLGGAPIGVVFGPTGHDCPTTPEVESLTISAAQYNAARGAGMVVIELLPTSAVNPSQCRDGTSVSITVRYQAPIEDCNHNGLLDACEIRDGLAKDCDGNRVPDECESDCDGDGTLDACEIRDGSAADCNGNGVPDDCEIAGGAARDCNGNGVPDGCDIAGGVEADCNGNGRPDACEVRDGEAGDCDGDGVLDSCEIASGESQDCDGDGVPDECAVAGGAVPDCNGNGVPDSCDIASGVSADCNENGVPDSCDIENGTSLDEDGDGVPDECVPRIVRFVSPEFAPLGTGFPHTYVVNNAPRALSDVTLHFRARGDLSSGSERVDVLLGGVAAGVAFGPGGHDCPNTPEEESLMISAAAFNAALHNRVVEIGLIASSSVNPGQCLLGSFIEVTVEYERE